MNQMNQSWYRPTQGRMVYRSSDSLLSCVSRRARRVDRRERGMDEFHSGKEQPIAKFHDEVEG